MSVDSLGTKKNMKIRGVMPILGYSTFLTIAVILLFTFSNIAFVMLRWLTPMNAPQTDRPDPAVEAFKDSDWDVEEHFAVSKTDFRFEPYTLWRRLPIASTTTNVDDQGLRSTWEDPRLQTINSNSIIKVYVLGGSTTWGSGAPDYETIPSWIARHLSNKGFHNVSVTNFGETGYTSTQEVIQLLLLIQEGRRPHIVIFYDGWNDVMVAVDHGHAGWPTRLDRMRTIYDQAIPEEGVGWLKRSQIHAGRFLHTFFTEGALLRWLRGELKEAPVLVHELPPEQLGRIAINRYIANMNTVEALSKTYGFEVYSFWQPCIWTKHPLSLEEARVAEGLRQYELPYRATVRLLRTKAATSKSIFEISDVFDGL